MTGEPERSTEGLVERVDGIAAWIHDLDARVRAAELATGDEKTARELRRAIETLSKHDPKLEKRLTNRVDVLADRLATLASTVSTAAAALARKDGEIASLRKDLEDAKKRVESLVKELGKGAGAEEIEKLRTAIRAVQAERPARGGDARVDALDGKIAYLTQRVDTLATTVATTAAGLAGREGELANLRQRLEQGSARLERTAVELRQLQGSATLADRLNGLQAALEETQNGLTAREREIAAVRSRIDEAYARVGSVVAELQGSLAALTSQVAGLERLPQETELAVESRTTELHARLDALASSVESTTQAVAQRDDEVAALRAAVENVSEHVDGVAGELRAELERLPVPGTLDPEVEKRIASLGAAIADLGERLSGTAAASSTHAEEAAARTDSLEALLGALAERLEALERSRDATADELAHVGKGLTEEREWVRGRLEALAEAQADGGERGDDGEALRALAARLETTENAHATVSGEVTRIAQTVDSERRAVRAQLEALSSALAQAADPQDSARALAELAARVDSLEGERAAAHALLERLAARLEEEHRSLRSEVEALACALESTAQSPASDDAARRLAELTARVESVERSGAAVASDVARTTAFWAAELEAVESRLDTLAETRESGNAVVAVEKRMDDLSAHLAELAAQTREAAAQPAGDVPGGDDLAELRLALDALRMRLASSEQELATLVGTRDLAARIEDLTRRLEAVERTPIAVVAADAGAAAGDGRFRLELRALELRMEHAEAAARENREAVLVQLERLAARIEWRFQRLEAEYEARHPEAFGGGQVVPLRPQAEV